MREIVRPALFCLMLITAGCADRPPLERIVPVTTAAPAPIVAGECFPSDAGKPAPFPTIPLDKGAKGASGTAVMGTLQRGKEAYVQATGEQKVCEASLRAQGLGMPPVTTASAVK